MARLEMYFLGRFEVFLDGQPLCGFETDKVRALLAYLAIETGYAHPRDRLAGLFWPERSETAAHTNLRGALSNLRQVLAELPGESPSNHLLINRDTIQFNPNSNFWTDVSVFEKACKTRLSDAEISEVQTVTELYRGQFLEGLTCKNCPEFDSWTYFLREKLQHLVSTTLCQIAEYYERYGEYTRAIDSARRRVEVEPWQEDAHFQLMRLLAIGGERSAAIAQYENCRSALEEELGVAPAEETRRLYTAILDGEMKDLRPKQVLPAPGDSPYRGLCFFDEPDAHLFFGREAAALRLVGRVEKMAQSTDGSPPLLAVVGASGSGKSSLVRAGVVPLLRRSGWNVQVITPTTHPLQALEAHGDWDLLVIDQFEELFSLCQEEFERAAFLERIFERGLPVLLVLRADFYGHCAAYSQLRSALSARQEFIGAMEAAGLRRAIEEPALRGGWELEPGLIDLLLDEVGASGDLPPEAGALPLLEHALLETWQHRRGRMLTLAGYQESGGVRGAIAQTAERVYGKFSPEEQSLARRVFLRLTELGQDTLDTRRRATLDELRAIGEGGHQVEGLLDALAAARLVTLGEKTAEVAHEALIREWPALQGWLAEDRDGLRLHRHLTESAAAWKRLGRDEGELYRGTRLAQTLEWAAQDTHTRELTPSEREFLSSSRQNEEREAREREEQHQRELSAAQKLAETERRRAEEREQAAQRIFREERLSYARELCATSKSKLKTEPDLSLLLALEAPNVLRQAGQPQPWDVQQAVHDVALDARLLWRREIPAGIAPGAYAPDGKRVYYAAYFDIDNQKVIALDAATGEELYSIQSDGGGVEPTLDGKYLATTNGAQAFLWDAVTGQKILTVPLASPDDLYQGYMEAVSPDGRYLLLNAGDEKGYLVDLEPWLQAGAPPGVTLILPMKLIDRCSGNCPGGAFSPDGKTFTTAWEKDSIYTLRDTETANPLRTFAGHTNWIRIASFSPDGSRLATSGFDNTVRVWEVSSARELMRLSGHTSGVHSVRYSRDGRRLVSASNDALVILWDAETGRRLLDLYPGGPAYAAAFSPDGFRLFSTSFSGIVTMWDISPSGRGELNTAPASMPIIWMDGSPDGSLVVESRSDGSVGLLDTTTMQELNRVVISQAPSSPILPTLSRDNTRMAVDVGGQISVREIPTGQILLDRPADDGWKLMFAFAPSFSPDGTRLASGGYSGNIILWNLVSGQKERVFPIRPGSRPQYSQFSPDGTRLAVGCWRTIDSGGGDVWIWDMAEPDKPPRTLNTDRYTFNGLSFSPDGRHLAVCGNELVGRIWDLASAEVCATLRGHTASINTIRYSPNGRYLVTACQDGTVRIWDAENGAELLYYHAPAECRFRTAFFTPDSRRVVAGSNDGFYRLLAFQDFGELLEIVRQRVTRDWTPEERRRYLRQEN